MDIRRSTSFRVHARFSMYSILFFEMINLMKTRYIAFVICYVKENNFDKDWPDTLTNRNQFKDTQTYSKPIRGYALLSPAKI